MMNSEKTHAKKTTKIWLHYAKEKNKLPVKNKKTYKVVIKIMQVQTNQAKILLWNENTTEVAVWSLNNSW